MTTINAPFTHAQLEGDLGSAYELADEIRLRTAEELDVLSQAGLLKLEGDLAGSGSDTIRVRNLGGIGFAATMTTVANETATVAPSTMVTGYDSIALGIHRYKLTESYTASGLRAPGVPSFRDLTMWTPGTIARKIRQMWAALGATITLSTGGTGTALDISDWLTLGAIFSTSVASYPLGRPKVALHPQQLYHQTNGLQPSARAETALIYGGPSTFGDNQGVGSSQILPNWLSLGMDIVISDDVTDDATDYQGFAYRPGSLGYAVMSTGQVETVWPEQTMRLPTLGAIIEWLTDGQAQTVLGFQATMWLGMALGSTSVWGPQYRVISKL